MPYIICVNTPGYLPEQDPTASATLAEARETVAAELTFLAERPGPPDARDRADAEAAVNAEGGIVHDLASGYVVDVVCVTWRELATLAGYNTASPRDDIAALECVEYCGQDLADEIIAAYNAGGLA